MEKIHVTANAHVNYYMTRTALKTVPKLKCFLSKPEIVLESFQSDQALFLVEMLV